jgi:hypothetical protein
MLEHPDVVRWAFDHPSIPSHLYPPVLVDIHLLFQ